MRYAILDAALPIDRQGQRGPGAQYVAWELARRRITEASYREADYILVSCTAATDAQYLRRLRAQCRQAVIIAGGAASTSPASLSIHADAVCVGDGQQLLGTLLAGGDWQSLPNVYIHGQSHPVAIDQGFPWHMPPTIGEDGSIRFVCGRGCRKRCAFCQVGWSYVYQEHPYPSRLISDVHMWQASGRAMSYVSNDLGQHSFADRLPPTAAGSYSLDYIRRRGVPASRQVRLGIEGVSERLRKVAYKPVTHTDLVNSALWLAENGRSVRWFLIAGLPSETTEDWLELRQAVQDFKRYSTKGVLALSFTAWCPDPATPLAVAQVTDDYWPRVTEFWEWFFAESGWSNRVKLMKPQQPENRNIKAEHSMGLPLAQLRSGGDWGPNDRVSYPYKQQAKSAATGNTDGDKTHK